MRALRVVASTWVGPGRARSTRAQGEREGGDTIISWRHRTQRALVPTISQAGSPDTMSRRRCFERFLRDPGLDAQLCCAPGDVRQRAHVGGDDAVLLR